MRIDNKNEIGSNDQDTIEDFDLKAVKYKKDKFEAIKPLYELYPEEKKEIIELPEKFLKLSIENKKFQKLLQACKMDIVTMSKTHGEKKDEILEDENASQTSQTGFDSGLVKKNRIEEIRRNLLVNVSNFFTLRYLRIASVLLGIGTTIFIVLYSIYFNQINTDLKNVSQINIDLFQSTYLTEDQLINLYWEKIPITFYEPLEETANETFPMSIDQMLSNIFSYLHDENYTLSGDNSEYVKGDENYDYFQYVTYLIIENTYDHILPNLYKKLIEFPKILYQYNNDQKNIVLIAIIIYAVFIVLICASIFSLIHLTNK